MMKLHKMMFLNTLAAGTLIAISSYSWMSMWMGLEINLLSMIPLMSSTKNMMSSESATKYFITQSMASLILLLSVSMMLMSTEFINPLVNSKNTVLVDSALMIKMGTAPFHFWLPEVMEGLTWTNCLIILTWQKIAPMILLMNNLSNNMFLLTTIISSLVVSSIMSFNQISMRKILAFSSINHMAWMISASMCSFPTWTIYMLIYSTITIFLTSTLKKTKTSFIKQMVSVNHNKKTKTTLSMNFLSLSGLPPFLGFLPKWMTINALITKKMITTATLLITMTLIMMFVYIRLMSSLLFTMTNEPKIKTQQKESMLSTPWNIINILGLILCTMTLNST